MLPLLAITGADLVAEANSWRVPKALAHTLVEITATAVATGAVLLAEDLGVPYQAAATIVARCAELLATL